MPSFQFYRGAFLILGACAVCSAWSAEGTPPSGAAQAPAAPAEQRFDVHEYRVLGNTALQAVDIERVLYPLLGDSKTLKDVEGAKAALEKLYHDRGYSTVYVDIPPQEVTDGIVRLKVTEGRVERERIEGAHYFSERDVVTRLPAATPGSVLNIPELQKQLAAVNAETADRAVVPVLKAGSTPGTLDLDFKVQDHVPVHGSLEINNQATLDTKPLRAIVGLSYSDLFGRLDNLAIQYQATPQKLDQVSVIAANYAVHLTTRWQPSFSFIHSNSDVPALGTSGVLGKGEIAGARLAYLLASEPDDLQSITLGFDYKHYRDTVNVDSSTSLVTPISYVDLSLAYAGTWRDSIEITTLSLSANAGPRGFANSAAEFADKRYKGRGNYFYLRGDGSVNFLLPKSFSFRMRLAGQAAIEPTISNEEYSIAGSDGVRGYIELEELGDSAIKGSVQFQSPPLVWRERQLSDGYLFFDAGRTDVVDALPGESSHVNLRSWGVGLDLLPGQKVTGSLTWAKPLVDGTRTRAGESRWLFILRGAF